MMVQPGEATPRATIPHALPKAARVLGSCAWFGGLIGVLTYSIALPFGHFVFIPFGIVLAFVFGAAGGGFCTPIAFLLLRTRDLTVTEPFVFWATAIITSALAGILPEKYVFDVMGLGAGVLLLMSLIARLIFPRVWEKSGLCRYCGYDIRASIEFGRCPECGSRLDQPPWYARREDLRGLRNLPLRIASVLVRYPSLPLIVVILASPVPKVYLAIRSEVRCRKIPAALEQAAARHEPFDLAACMSFPWEKCYVFGPYTDRAGIERTLGFSWPTAARTGIEMGDAYNLLVFVHDDTFAAHVDILSPWKFAPSVCGRPITPQHAVFLIEEQPWGAQVLHLRDEAASSP